MRCTKNRTSRWRRARLTARSCSWADVSGSRGSWPGIAPKPPAPGAPRHHPNRMRAAPGAPVSHRDPALCVPQPRTGYCAPMPAPAPERAVDPSLVDDLREVLLAATLYDERRRHEGGPPTTGSGLRSTASARRVSRASVGEREASAVHDAWRRHRALRPCAAGRPARERVAEPAPGPGRRRRRRGSRRSAPAALQQARGDRAALARRADHRDRRGSGRGRRAASSMSWYGAWTRAGDVAGVPLGALAHVEHLERRLGVAAVGSSSARSRSIARDRPALLRASSSCRRAGSRRAVRIADRGRELRRRGGRPRRRGRRTRPPARGRRARPAASRSRRAASGSQTAPGMCASSNCWSVRTSTSSAPSARLLLDLARRERQHLDAVASAAARG